MPIIVRCQQCGRRAQFSDEEIGLAALCPACGMRFNVPPTSTVDQPAEIPTPTTAADVATVVLESEDSQPPNQPELVPQPTVAQVPYAQSAVRQPEGARKAMFIGLLSGAAISLLLVLGALMLWLRPNWELAHGAQIRQIKSEAESLVLANRLSEAYDAYRRIDELVEGREIRDASLRADLERASAARDRLFATLSMQARQPNRTGNTPDAAPQSPAAPAPSPQVPSTSAIPPEHPSGSVTDPATMPQTGLITNTDSASAGSPSAASSSARAAPRVEITIRPPAARTPRLPNESGQRRGLNPRRAIGAGNQPVNDDEIGQAIQQAVNFLLGQFRNGRLQSFERNDDGYEGGLNALCVYALLQASYAVSDERLNLKGTLVRELLDGMKKSPMQHGHVTYSRALRATALALVNRPEDREALKADVNYLINGHQGGAYTYQPVGRVSQQRRAEPMAMFGGWDNSNSQYGLLGVWSGAEVGMEVNNSYWQAVEKHWTSCQNSEGTWGYSGAGGEPRLSMTLAGIASLFVTHEYLDAPKAGTLVGRDPFSPPLKKALAHLESGQNALDIEDGYTLYGLERVGLASGFKFFGEHDWYRELAAAAVASQEANGSWRPRGSFSPLSNTLVETSFNLLFLARGRHPILMNKLRYEGSWANRPRDLSNLARYGSKQLERQLNWQVVPIERDWPQWTDSPILYIASHVPVKFSDQEIEKLRSFVQSGGMLFTHADGNGIPASNSFEELGRRLFPRYEFQNLPEQHEIFRVLFKPSPRPPLRYISNGSRVLMLHSPTDVSHHWQLRMDKSQRASFELGVNMFLYAAGKTDLRNRLSSPYIAPQGEAGGGTLRVVRLKYAGNWDPEPMAWTRFARYFQRATDVAVDVSAMDLEQLRADAANGPNPVVVAHLTGTSSYTFTPAQLAAIKSFVEAGGVLLVDAAGGSFEFAESFRSAMLKAFPGTTLSSVPSEHPLLSGAGQPGATDVGIPLVRPYVRNKTPGFSGRLQRLTSGKGCVLFSALDITTGLLGANTWSIYGFSPDYACELTKNILIWSAMGMREP